MTTETHQPSSEEHKEFMRQIPRLMEAELFEDQTIVKVDTIGSILITRTPDLKDFLRATFVFDGESFVLDMVVLRENPLASEKRWDPNIFDEEPFGDH